MDELQIENISPYDNEYPLLLLEDVFQCQLKVSDKVIDNFCIDVVNNVEEYIEMPKAKEEYKLVVDASSEMLEDIKNGKVKLVQENGNIYAQLRENGKYSKKLPIKEENIKDISQVQLALQLKEIKEDLEIIKDQLIIINDRVKDVLIGLQNDRIALYYSGISLYLESLSLSDLELRKQILSQAIKSLTESNFKLILNIKSDILYLKNREYDLEKKKRAELIKGKIDSINQSFMIIHQSFVLKAAIYCKTNEIKAMALTLSEYSSFLNNTIAPNAVLLAQCDMIDKSAVNGMWNRRGDLQLDTINLLRQLENKNN